MDFYLDKNLLFALQVLFPNVIENYFVDFILLISIQ